ncbi:MAG TPA: Ig-like domain-containing protein, partial [Verrucomicrobiae bacterium]
MRRNPMARGVMAAGLGLGMWLATPDARPQSLSEALDATGVVWTTSVVDSSGQPAPGGEWTGQTAVTHDGVDAARSGVLTLFHTSRLRTESFVGPGTVTLWRRHGLSGGSNPFAMYANGYWLGLFLPGGAWQPVAIDLPPGPATLDFSWYNTDVSGLAADNFAYVDEVAFHSTTGAPTFFPNPPPSLTVAEGYTIQVSTPVLGEKPMLLLLGLPGQSFFYQHTVPALQTNAPPVLSGLPYGFTAATNLAGTWTIVASNAVGVVTNTFSVTITPAAPHSIYIDGPIAAWAGATVTLTANTRGTAPFTYQWEKSGSPLVGATNQTLVLANFSAADAGEFTVVVSNALGFAESPPHTIVLGSLAPSILSQSTNLNLTLYDWGVLEVNFDGTPPFWVKWERDGQVITESELYYQDASFYLYGHPENDPGIYVVTITNGLGKVQSNPMIVQVGDGVEIAEAMDNRTVGWRYQDVVNGWSKQTNVTHDGVDAVGIFNQSPTPLRTAVQGPGVVSFWWRVVDGGLAFSLDNILEETLTASGGDSGWQQVTRTLGPGWHELEWQTQSLGNPTAEAYLDEFQITGGGGNLAILSHPQGGNFNFGDTVSLSVSVTGVGPFTYRLFKDETLLQTVSGEPSSSHSFDLLLGAGSPGAYWIEVVDAANQTAASDDAVISVDGDFGSLINLATAVNQRTQTWHYTDYSVLDNTSHPPVKAWYRTRADGVPAGRDRCVRTPVLQTGELAAVVMELDEPSPMRLRFWMKLAGASPSDVFGLAVNGALVTPNAIGTQPGTSGDTWSGYEVNLAAGFSEIQWEVLAQTNGVVGYLGLIELTPATPPEITQQPANLFIPAGETNALSVLATSPVPLTYQWFKLGTGALVGQTNATLAFAPAAVGDAGQYLVQVINAFGTTPSATVTVTVTGPRPQITQPLQPQWLQPGQNLFLEAAASSGNGALAYRWYRNSTLVQNGGTSFQRTGVTSADSGLYRVEVSDPYYTVASEARVTVSPLLYNVTWLWSYETNGVATPYSVNNSGVVAGYAWGPTSGGAVTVWTNASPLRLTPPGAPFSWSYSINDAGDIVGVQFGTNWLQDPNAMRRWSPPYSPASFTDLGAPVGHPFVETARINNRGEIVTTETGAGLFGQPRFSFRYTATGGWEPLGPIVGTTPLGGALEQGWSTALDINNAGVIVGLSYFQQPNFLPTQATGWFFDPATTPRQRTAMDTLGAPLALTPAQPWGWLDAVNDLGDVVGRRWATNAPTKLYLRRATGQVDKLLELPVSPAFDGESFNVDALNNRREMVGYYHVAEGQRAALMRDRNSPPGGTPTSFNNFALLDLNDLVIGGTGDFVLLLANDINDAGQIVGSTSRVRGTGDTPGFLLTPVTPYPPLPARAVEDVLSRPAGQSLVFSAATLTVNDLGLNPLNVIAVASTSIGGGTITDLGGGQYRYDPPAGPDAPDGFTYTVQAADGSSAVGAVRVAPAPPP